MPIARFTADERRRIGDSTHSAPCPDDTSTARDTAFAKIAVRVEGTAQASQALGL